MNKIDFVILYLMRSPGKWKLALHFEDGNEAAFPVMEGKFEDYLLKNGWLEYEVKVFDCNTQSWSDYTQKA